MPLDPSYLTYPRRRHGMDHDLYPWSNLFERAPLVWPNSARVSVWIVVSLEWFPLTPADTPFRAPGHMQTPYPDYRHYTAREYGTRVGMCRLLDAFAKVGARVSVATNGAVAARYPALVKDIVERGHEVIAHSTDMNGTIDSSVAEADERAMIVKSLDTLEDVVGQRPIGWLSIARSQSRNTPRLLKEAALTYSCDWVNDELPYVMTTEAGPLLNLPLSHELSDRQILGVQQQNVDSYVVQIKDAYAWLDREARRFGPRLLPLHITPYITALPYRIDAFERLLGWLSEQDGTRFMTGGEIAACARTLGE